MRKRNLIVPAAEEDAKIAAGIAADPDTMELSSSEIAQAVRAKRGPGRPAGSVKADAKHTVSIRLDPDLLDAMRSTGTSWQTRANQVLRREFLARPSKK